VNNNVVLGIGVNELVLVGVGEEFGVLDGSGVFVDGIAARVAVAAALVCEGVTSGTLSVLCVCWQAAISRMNIKTRL
jgi:hypothetical protein